VTDRNEENWPVYGELPSIDLPPEPQTWTVYGDRLRPASPASPAPAEGADLHERRRADLRRLAQRPPQDPKPVSKEPLPTAAEEETPGMRLRTAARPLVLLLAVVFILVAGGSSYGRHRQAARDDWVAAARAKWNPGFERPDRASVNTATMDVDLEGWDRIRTSRHPPNTYGAVATATFVRDGVELFATAQFSNDSDPISYGTVTQFDEGVLCSERHGWARQCIAPMDRGFIEVETVSAQITLDELAALTATLYRAQP
jgi:hypothetical protein